MEIWKDVIWYEWKYQASSSWRVKTLNAYWRKGEERILSPGVKDNGYLKVVLYDWPEQEDYLVHRLIIETFEGRLKWKIVNHKNWNKKDNSLSNLERVTYKENSRHAFDKLKIKPGRKWKKVKKTKIKQFDINWVFIKKWSSIKEAAEKTLTNPWGISNTCLWKQKTAGGFTWKYI